MLDFIENADAPFFSFMFFESAHANYYFPEDSVIEPDYIGDFNYLTVDIEQQIERIRARYLNAVHHLDSQLARVFDTLQTQGLLENTIVIVTGDHGEEFMENGRWGHNSTFSQQQIAPAGARARAGGGRSGTHDESSGPAGHGACCAWRGPGPGQLQLRQ